MKKNKRYNVIVLILIILLLLLLIICYINFKDRQIYSDQVKIRNQNILLISEEYQKQCIKDLINYLNDEYFYECNTITFYNNTFDTENNKKYFYALAVGRDQSLIEIKNLGNGNFEYSYIGNELTPDATSQETGVSYLQIIDPEEYEKQEKLKEIRESADTSIIDSTPNKETVIE